MEIQRYGHKSILRLAGNLLIRAYLSYEPQHSLVGVIKGVLDAAVFTTNLHNFSRATSTWQNHCGQERSIRRTKVKQFVNTMRPRQNGRHFQIHFREWKFCILIRISLELVQLTKCIIGCGNGLVPSRRQAIIWTNVDPVHRRIYGALGGDEFRLLYI